MYMSLAALVAVFVLGVHTWLGRRSLGLFLALAVVSGLLASWRNADYRNAVAIWSDTVAKHEGNPRAHNNLGFALIQAGRVPEAIVHLEQAVQLNPPIEAILSQAGLKAICEMCGEEIINRREVVYDGVTLCRTCANGGYYNIVADFAPRSITWAEFARPVV